MPSVIVSLLSMKHLNNETQVCRVQMCSTARMREDTLKRDSEGRNVSMEARSRGRKKISRQPVKKRVQLGIQVH